MREKRDLGHPATRGVANPDSRPPARTREQDWRELSADEKTALENLDPITPRVAAFLRRWEGQ